MKDLIVALLVWIGAHSPLVYDGVHRPQVFSLPQEELVRMRFYGEMPQPLDIDSVSVLGLYNHRDGNIYLLEGIDLGTVEGQSVLVHELVHYLQFRHGLDRKVECNAVLERDAYEIQSDYLSQHGKGPAFDKMHIFLVSTCRRD